MRGFVERPTITSDLSKESSDAALSQFMLQVQKELSWPNKPEQKVQLAGGTTGNTIAVESPRITIEKTGSGTAPEITKFIAPLGYEGPLYLFNVGSATWKVMGGSSNDNGIATTGNKAVGNGKTLTLIRRERKWYLTNTA